MPRTRTAFASKAFTDRRWTILELCALSFAAGATAAAVLAVIFIALG